MTQNNTAAKVVHTETDRAEIVMHLHRAFGGTCEIESVKRFHGGTRKQVFFLHLSVAPSICALYIWHDENRYFTEREDDTHNHSDSRAPLLLKTNTDFLLAHGIGVPRIYYMGVLESGYHFAFLEYIAGGSLQTFMETQPTEAQKAVLEKFGTMVHRLHTIQRDFPGTLLDDARGVPLPQDAWLERGLLELNAAADTEPPVAEKRDQIEAKMRTLYAQIAPRTDFRYIHGEMGPDHVLLGQSDLTPHLVDVDGMHFTDVELEYAILAMRFAPEIYARYLHPQGLDPARTAFYKFGMHVSFVYGGSRLLRGNHENRALAESILYGHLKHVLNSL